MFIIFSVFNTAHKGASLSSILEVLDFNFVINRISRIYYLVQKAKMLPFTIEYSECWFVCKNWIYILVYDNYHLILFTSRIC